MSSSIKNETDAQDQQDNEALARVHKDESVLNAANKLLIELKKAYGQILQAKENEILHLKQEVADLNTLVRVLESENERLKAVKNFY